MSESARLDFDPRGAVDAAAAWLIERAVVEDWGEAGDLTSQAVIPEWAVGEADFVSRDEGVVCGLPICRRIFDRYAPDARVEFTAREGDGVAAGTRLGTARGSARQILALERTCLNFLGRLSGIATLTRAFVRRVPPRVRIVDTRKTTPGWRVLEKYAVRCGGGINHRLGLYDGVMIKDNHLALASALPGAERLTAGAALQRAREWLRRHPSAAASGSGVPLVVEVDRVEILAEVLAAGPDLVLLDNLSVASLRQAVALRDQLAPHIELEASGGVTLESIAAVAASGVDRISIGALTHSVKNHDVALDWRPPADG